MKRKLLIGFGIYLAGYFALKWYDKNNKVSMESPLMYAAIIYFPFEALLRRLGITKNA